MNTPLFDHVFKTGESAIPSSVVRSRAIQSQSIAPARSTDPETAHEAANANQEIRGEQRRRVYEYLKSCGPNGATDYEISVACGILRTSAGKRRKEIQDLGYVIDPGTRRQTDSNSSAIVWKIK